MTATLRAAGARFALVHGSRVLAVLRKEAAADDRRRADACGWAG